MMENNSATVEVILKSMTYKFVDLVGIDDIKRYRFIPIEFKEGYLYIVVENTADTPSVESCIIKVLPNCPNIRYVKLPSSVFEQVLDAVLNKYPKPSDTRQRNHGNQQSSVFMTILKILASILAGVPFLCKIVSYFSQ